jgi:hypothetical protein
MHFFFDRVLFKPNMVLRPFISLAQPSGLGALTWPKTNTNPKKNIWAFFVIKKWARLNTSNPSLFRD